MKEMENVSSFYLHMTLINKDEKGSVTLFL